MGDHPDSRWTHPQCDDCWFDQNSEEIGPGPDGEHTGQALLRAPLRIAEAEREWEQCCFCGGMTFSGIYVRHDPTDLSTWCEQGRV